MPNKHIELEEYIDLLELVEQSSQNEEKNRRFGLGHEELLQRPILLLKEWIEEHRYTTSCHNEYDTMGYDASKPIE